MNLENEIKNIYKELEFIKLEFEFMKKLDDSIEENQCSFKNIETIHFIVIDSLWYSIIMRIAKIWDYTKGSKSLFKIFNTIKTDKKMSEIRSKISYKEISEMQYKISNAMKGYDNKVKSVNLFIESRNNYFAHINQLDSPQATQEKYLIGRNKIENVIKTLFEIVELICERLNIDIVKENINTKIRTITDIEYPYFIKSIMKI